MESEHKYGYFNEEGTEFTITDPKTPRAFDNFLWNDSLFSAVHQTGVGYFDYQVGKLEAVKLLTGIGRICDFDVFGREGLMSRLIYVRDNNTGEFWNVNWEPVKKAFDSFECTHGLGYTNIRSLTSKIQSGFRIFVPKGSDPLELWTLSFENKDLAQRDLSIFVYNQFIFTYKWGFNSYGDMLFRSSWFNEELNAMMAKKQPHVSPHDYQTAFMTASEPIVGYDGSRDFFVGTYNALNEPEAVIRGKCSNSSGSSDSTIGVTQFDIKLAPGQEHKIQMILGVTDQEDKVEKIKEKYLDHVEDYFEILKKENASFLSHNTYTTPDPHLNRMLNTWIKHQTSYGARWCRWGWMGYRDIVQHGYGVSSFNPTRTREILLEALKHQNANGMALRGWNPVDEKAYSDSALWLVFSLTSYLKETGDMDFLGKLVEYYDQGCDTVLAHVEQALDFLEQNKGEHELCLIKFGDWNDSLTAIGKEGRGESIWLSMAYAEALREMQALYKEMGEREKEADYSLRYERIKKAVNEHAWDGDWYVRCFDDNGRPIGSSSNEQGKIFLNAQSWAMISGIADEERTAASIVSSDKMLATRMGYLLLAPTFFEPDDHIGRISCLEPGICENGTVYSHVNAWMVMGLLRAGKPDKAYETFRKITPGYPTEGEFDPKEKMPPYIYANGYFGPDHRNNKFQMEFTWITGSVAWYYNILSREMLGIQAEYRGLRMDPKLPSDWMQCSAVRQFRGKEFHISMERSDVSSIQVHLNGKLLPDTLIPLNNCLKENQVRVLLPRS
ncbi:MAG: hypothetical protein QNK35_03635 [Bacteroides sp.]|nr:hypothetical protein [Bacteroides sp.]